MNFLFEIGEKVIVKTEAVDGVFPYGRIEGRTERTGGEIEYDVHMGGGVYEWVAEGCLRKLDEAIVQKVDPLLVLAAYGLVARPLDAVTVKVVLEQGLEPPVCPGHPVNLFLAASAGKGFEDVSDALLLLLDCLQPLLGREGFDSTIFSFPPSVASGDAN